jgi:hypothetical protein
VIPHRLARLSAVVLIAASAGFATACAATPSATESPSSAAPVPSSPTPEPSAAATSAPDADPACDTIIPASVVSEFEGLGWTVHAEPLRINGVPVSDGLQCTWGDFTIATDHVQIFGWAPIASDAATKAQSDLVSSGWSREDGPAGTYITEDPSTAIATDADGFGLTYLFGDGWVKYADTKQGLLLVQWPPA